jgi:CHAT domain-containing protein/tetratricopeptide (TPR) repeat protein
MHHKLKIAWIGSAVIILPISPLQVLACCASPRNASALIAEQGPKHVDNDLGRATRPSGEPSSVEPTESPSASLSDSDIRIEASNINALMKYPKSSFLKSLSEENLSVINHFGEEAAAKLDRYIMAISRRLLSLGVPVHDLGASQSISIDMSDPFIAILSERSRSHIRAHGSNVFALFNRYGTTLESVVLSALAAELRSYGNAPNPWIGALEEIQLLLGEDHKNTLEIAKRAALFYARAGMHGKAERLFKDYIRSSERVYGLEHPVTASWYDSLANSYFSQGLYSQAEPLYKRTVAILEKVHGSDHPSTAASLNKLAVLYSRQGLYSQAEPLYSRALAIREKALGPDHPSTATSLNNLAGLYQDQGLYSRAEPLYRRALAILEKALGPDHPDTATSLSNLAGLYQDQGLYSQAEPLYRRALAISEKALGPDHPRTATSLNNLAVLYIHQGLYSQAEPLSRRALAIWEKALGPDHPRAATSLNNLAVLYIRQGLYSQAEPLYRRALAISEKALGPDHPDTATSLNNLAGLYSDQGLYSKAEPLYRRALAISEKALGPDHPVTATSLNNLALLYSRQRLYSQAEPLSRRALAILEKALGPDHLRTATSLNNLAGLYQDKGLYSQAADHLRQGIEAQTIWLTQEALLQPAENRLSLASIMGSAWQVPSSWVDKESSAADLAFTARLQRHGLLLEIQRRQTLLARADPAQQQLASQVSALNGQLSDVSITPAQRQVLRKRRDELEAQLNRQLPQLAIPQFSPAQVAQQLPSDGVLIAFQRFRAWNSKAAANQRWGDGRYLALILSPDGSIQHQQLGDAAPIDAAIRKAIDASATNNTDANDRWADVARLVIDPLRPHVSRRRQWFISPDAELHRVPFEALPSSGARDGVLATEVRLRVLTSGRDLITLQKPTPSGGAPLVIANPNYERGARAPATVVATAVPQQRSAGVTGKRWEPLPASAAEGDQLASLLGINAVTGDQATVTLLESSHGPRILHIASHGFFEPDQEIPPQDQQRAVVASNELVQRFQGEDPLLRSGIVLAGANNPGLDPNDDGLLTAQEAAGLQLDGTELVVLSACSTAQGDLRTGEGVFGLQRAFTVAGARSTLLSLWKVDDAATAEFMVRFYQRLKAGEGRADALAAVQAEFRNGSVQGPDGEDWSTPYYWAAWQLTGDWRPIPGL